MDYHLILGSTLSNVPLHWENASNGHLALLGQSGRGKSWALKKYLSQLPPQGVHAFIFDGSGDFRSSSIITFLDDDLPVSYLDVRNQVLINPFRPMKLSAAYMEEPADTAARLTEMILDAYRFRGAAQPVHLRNALTAYMSACEPYPSFPALAAFIRADKRRADKMAPVLARLSDLERLFPGVGGDFRWELDRPGITVLQFDTIPDQATQALVTELLLADLWMEKLQDPEGTCPVVVLLDECQRFSFQESSMLVRILREGRKFHINGWFASQWLENKTAVHALEQAALRAYYYPGDRNAKALARMLCPDAQQIRQYENLIRRLQVGQFLYADQSGRVLLNCVPR